jgi:hypothetical protein
MIGVSNHIRAVDVRGKVHEMRGTAIAGHPQYTINPCQAVFQTLFRYEVDGRVGYGESADCFRINSSIWEEMIGWLECPSACA